MLRRTLLLKLIPGSVLALLGVKLTQPKKTPVYKVYEFGNATPYRGRELTEEYIQRKRQWQSSKCDRPLWHFPKEQVEPFGPKTYWTRYE